MSFTRPRARQKSGETAIARFLSERVLLPPPPKHTSPSLGATECAAGGGRGADVCQAPAGRQGGLHVAGTGSADRTSRGATVAARTGEQRGDAEVRGAVLSPDVTPA